jgi:hypothetical protein
MLTLSFVGHDPLQTWHKKRSDAAAKRRATIKRARPAASAGPTSRPKASAITFLFISPSCCVWSRRGLANVLPLRTGLRVRSKICAWLGFQVDGSRDIS